MTPLQSKSAEKNKKWATDVLWPALAGVKLSEITAATGAAKSTASGWRKGAVPHPMHWEKLAVLVEVEVP